MPTMLENEAVPDDPTLDADETDSPPRGVSPWRRRMQIPLLALALGGAAWAQTAYRDAFAPEPELPAGIRCHCDSHLAPADEVDPDATTDPATTDPAADETTVTTTD